MSGILQQGYSFGYVMAAVGNLAVGGATESWRTIFWAGGEFSKKKKKKKKILHSHKYIWFLQWPLCVCVFMYRAELMNSE